MNNNPLVSIIIPTYNRAHLIKETLDSVLMQTYENWECIVVDDGSEDNTKEIIEEYLTKDSRFQFHDRPKDRLKGGNAARNYGYELSKGEYINWFDDDDIMLQNFIFDKVKLFYSDQIQLVICSMSYTDEKLQEMKKVNLELKTFLFKEYVTWNLKIITNSVLFKKSFLQDKELFNLKIFRGQETEFFSRLFFCLPESNYKIINKPLFLYRQHEETKTAKNKLYVFDYKESQTYISLENLKKSLIINDKYLINYYYKILIVLFFRSLNNNHLSNSGFIISNFVPILIKMKKRIGLEFYILGNIFILMKRGSYRFEKYFKSFQF